MGEFLDRIAEVLNLERFANMFRDNEEFIMTRGLRMVAIGCVIIALVYGALAFLQFRNF